MLVDIAFVNEKVGHAAGTGGLLLSTDDGGQTWKSRLAAGAIRAFSFADAMNGIAVFGEESASPRVSSSDQAVPIEGTVKITHDAGQRWEDIAAINSEGTATIRSNTLHRCTRQLAFPHAPTPARSRGCLFSYKRRWKIVEGRASAK